MVIVGNVVVKCEEKIERKESRDKKTDERGARRKRETEKQGTVKLRIIAIGILKILRNIKFRLFR